MACEHCGKPVTAAAPAGMCPACLLRTAVEHGSSRVMTTVLPKLRYFGDYELLDEIAFGGMGVVYRARQVSLDRVVAIKMMRPGVLATDDEIRRFQTEARTAASMQHPNIVAIHEVGECEGLHYFSMDFVDGPNLAELIRHKPLPSQEAARYVQLLADAVQYAHSKGILHRDLKPSNVVVDAAGRPRITDFGLARPLDTGSGMTANGALIGTPAYMPPEQAAADGQPLTAATDCYSLGAILYELLTGRPPFQAGSPVATLRAVLEDEPAPPRSVVPAVDRDLEAICLHCLEKNPAHRYTSAEELSADLRRYLNGDHVMVRRRALSRKSGGQLALLAVLAILLIVTLTRSRQHVEKHLGSSVRPAPAIHADEEAPRPAVQPAAVPGKPAAKLLKRVVTAPAGVYSFRWKGPATAAGAEIEFLDAASGRACRIFAEPDSDRLSLQVNPVVGRGLRFTGSPGGYGELENSACSVDLGGAEFVRKDGAIEIHLPVKFSPSFPATRQLHIWRIDPATGMRATDGDANGWTVM